MLLLPLLLLLLLAAGEFEPKISNKSPPREPPLLLLLVLVVLVLFDDELRGGVLSRFFFFSFLSRLRIPCAGFDAIGSITIDEAAAEAAEATEDPLFIKVSNDDDPPIDDVVVVVLLPPNGLIGALDVLLVEPPRLPRPPNGSPLEEVVEADATVVRLVSPNPNVGVAGEEEPPNVPKLKFGAGLAILDAALFPNPFILLPPKSIPPPPPPPPLPPHI